jgi:hypothetical protein
MPAVRFRFVAFAAFLLVAVVWPAIGRAASALAGERRISAILDLVFIRVHSWFNGMGSD